MNESAIDTNIIWYFGNNRSRNLRLTPPQWYAPFFLTSNYKYAIDYSDYGVYAIDLKTETESNILDFNFMTDTNTLMWPKVLINMIKSGTSDLNGIAYDMYDLAFNNGENLLYISKSKAWLDCVNYFKAKSKNIMKSFRPISVWGSEADHMFLLQMWKDIYDAGFNGFTHSEFRNKILAIFSFKCIDKISIHPINKP